VGDSVDNVPGVPGIGLKTAVKLLQEHGSLDKLLAQLQTADCKLAIGKKVLANLQTAVESGALKKSRQLVLLDRRVPIEMDWEAWRLQDWDAGKLLARFREGGFRGCADEVRKASLVACPSPSVAEVSVAPTMQGELFRFGANIGANGQAGAVADEVQVPKDNWQATYHLVNTPDKLAAFLRDLRQQRRLAVDLETTHLEPRRAEV